MAGILIALVLVVVLSHLVPAVTPVYRDPRPVPRWLAQCANALRTRPAQGLALAVMVPVLIVAVLAAVFDRIAFGAIGLLFDVAVLLYAWGPRDLAADVEAVLDTRDRTTRREAARHLFAPPAPVSIDAGALVVAVFCSALQRWFAVALWFVVLGPAGALGYRLIALCGHADEVPAPAQRLARRVADVLEWPAAQLMALTLAVVGDFNTVRDAWRNAGGASLQPDPGFIGPVGRASVRVELAQEAEDDALDVLVAGLPPPVPRPLPELDAVRDALSLVRRCLMVWLGAVAVIVIAGWVA